MLAPTVRAWRGDNMSIKTADNEALVRREIQHVWDSEGDLDAIPDLVTDDFVFHNPMLDEPARGPAEYRALVAGFHDAFSGMKHHVEEMHAVDDVVVTRYRTRATNDGELMGNEPTGKEIDVTGIVVDHLRDDKLAERYVNDDALGLLEQLGIVELPRRPDRSE